MLKKCLMKFLTKSGYRNGRIRVNNVINVYKRILKMFADVPTDTTVSDTFRDRYLYLCMLVCMI